MPQYKIKHTSIMHNNKLCKEGSIIELTADEAARLEEFVELVPSAKTSTTKNTTSNKSKTQTKTPVSVDKTNSSENEGGGKSDDK